MSTSGIAVDGAGGPTVTYGLGGAANFGGGSIASQGFAIASFDANGTYRWAYADGPPTTAAQSGTGFQGIAASARGAVVVGSVGTCTGSCSTSPNGTTFVLDGETLIPVSAGDLFIASFAP